MSNLHLLLDEANKHDPKGFIPAVNNTFPWKDELGLSTYREQMELPKAINFVDGTVAAPTTVDGDVYVLTGSGVVDSSWGNATFGDWVRFTNTIATEITPLAGYLCYDVTAASWMEFDGAVWAVFGGGGGSNIYTANGTLLGNRSVAQNTNDLIFFTTGGGSTLHIDGANGNIGIGSSTPPASKRLYVNGDSHFAGDILIDDELHILNGVVKNETTLGSFLTEHAFLNNMGTQGQILAGGSTYGVGGNLELITNSFGVRGTNDFSIGARNGDIKFSLGADFTNANTRAKFTSTGAIFGAAVGLVSAGAELHVKGSGITSGTAALLVQNNSGSDLLRTKDDGTISATSLSTYVGDFAAGVGGLVAGDIYKTSTGELRIKT